MMAAADKKERKRGKKREVGGQMEGDVENSAGRGGGVGYNYMSLLLF